MTFLIYIYIYVYVYAWICPCTSSACFHWTLQRGHAWNRHACVNDCDSRQCFLNELRDLIYIYIYILGDGRELSMNMYIYIYIFTNLPMAIKWLDWCMHMFVNPWKESMTAKSRHRAACMVGIEVLIHYTGPTPQASHPNLLKTVGSSHVSRSSECPCWAFWPVAEALPNAPGTRSQSMADRKWGT